MRRLKAEISRVFLSYNQCQKYNTIISSGLTGINCQSIILCPIFQLYRHFSPHKDLEHFLSADLHKGNY